MPLETITDTFAMQPIKCSVLRKRDFDIRKKPLPCSYLSFT